MLLDRVGETAQLRDNPVAESYQSLSDDVHKDALAVRGLTLLRCVPVGSVFPLPERWQSVETLQKGLPDVPEWPRKILVGISHPVYGSKQVQERLAFVNSSHLICSQSRKLPDGGEESSVLRSYHLGHFYVARLFSGWKLFGITDHENAIAYTLYASVGP